jgi:hypothetical protein
MGKKIEGAIVKKFLKATGSRRHFWTSSTFFIIGNNGQDPTYLIPRRFLPTVDVPNQTNSSTISNGNSHRFPALANA